MTENEKIDELIRLNKERPFFEDDEDDDRYEAADERFTEILEEGE